ncbi:MAG: hypothetical protein JW833_00750, partial [Prolixibacteraceae bacterium]|nr:hypothetical protein [Prolixibacteraceae bacterium]
DGWLSLIRNPKNDLIPIYVDENCIAEGKINVSLEIVKNHNIDLEANNHFTSFYYVDENFNGDSDNFTFETAIKNDPEEGALVCQRSEVSILSEFGRHFIQFCNPRCIGELYLKLGTELISGENNDLSAFGTNMDEWNIVKIEIRNKLATIYLNEKVIYKTSYESSNGKIKGLYYNFSGSGSVDYARLYNSDNTLVFSEDFE